MYVRPVLENPELSESVEAMEALDMDLLMAVRDTGAKLSITVMGIDHALTIPKSWRRC